MFGRVFKFCGTLFWMSIIENIEIKLKKILDNLDKENFIYDFLEAYNQPKSTIKRIKDGDYNLSKEKGKIIWKKKMNLLVRKL